MRQHGVGRHGRVAGTGGQVGMGVQVMQRDGHGVSSLYGCCGLPARYSGTSPVAARMISKNDLTGTYSGTLLPVPRA